MSVAHETHLKKGQEKTLFLLYSSPQLLPVLYALKKYLCKLDSSLFIKMDTILPKMSLKKHISIVAFIDSIEELEAIQKNVTWIIAFNPLSPLPQLPKKFKYFPKPTYIQDIAIWIAEKILMAPSQKQSSSEKILIGPFLFAPHIRLLTHQKTSASFSLTEKETSLLLYLIEKKGQLVGKEELLEKIWGYKTGISTRTLESHIYSLRQKLEETSSTPKILLTQKGGYLLYSS